MKKEIGKIDNFAVYQLDRKLAKKYSHEIAKMVDQIPLVDYTPEKILAESKEDRIYYGKWEHSLVVFDKTKPIAVIIAYERKSENNTQYPDNTIYIGELAVDQQYQKRGIGKKLLELFFKYNLEIGLLHLDGKINFSLQTNSANWNHHVQDLYKSFGFTQRATKQYDNRTDIVLGWYPNI